MRRIYYWIYTQDETGRPYLLGKEGSEEQARQKGLELLAGGDFKIIPLPTSDYNRASAMIKGKRLESSHSLRESTRRIGRDKSFRRLFRRRNI